MKIYITFGQVHVHSVNGKTFDKDCVAVIDAESKLEGRKIARELFDNKYFTSYTEFGDDKLEYFPRGFLGVNISVCPRCASDKISNKYYHSYGMLSKHSYLECEDCGKQWDHI